MKRCPVCSKEVSGVRCQRTSCQYVGNVTSRSSSDTFEAADVPSYSSSDSSSSYSSSDSSSDCSSSSSDSGSCSSGD